MGRSCYVLGNKATGCVPFSASKSKFSRTVIPGVGAPCHPGFCASGLPHPGGTLAPPRDWGNPIRPPPWEYPRRASDAEKQAPPANVNGTACFCQSDLCNGDRIKTARTAASTLTDAAQSAFQITNSHSFIVIGVSALVTSFEV